MLEVFVIMTIIVVVFGAIHYGLSGRKSYFILGLILTMCTLTLRLAGII